MRDRYTIKDARRVFAELCEVYGKVNGFYTESFDPNETWFSYPDEGTKVLHTGKTTFTPNIGAWHLDENFVYGGVVIEELFNAGGGVTMPFGYTRRTCREFCDWAGALIYGRRSAAS